MYPSVRPLAAGAFYRARLPAATGRAGLEVGPHEHLAGGAPQWRGNVGEDRTHPEEDKHRCERPPSCSEEYSHADPSLLHGRLRTGDIEDRFRWAISNERAAPVAVGLQRRAGARFPAWDRITRAGRRPALAACGTRSVRKVPRRLAAACIRYRALYGLQARWTPYQYSSSRREGSRPGGSAGYSGDRVSAPARPSAPA